MGEQMYVSIKQFARIQYLGSVGEDVSTVKMKLMHSSIHINQRLLRRFVDSFYEWVGLDRAAGSHRLELSIGSNHMWVKGGGGVIDRVMGEIGRVTGWRFGVGRLIGSQGDVCRGGSLDLRRRCMGGSQ